MIDASVVELAPEVGTAAACRALNTSLDGVYRRRSPRPVTAKFALHSDRFEICSYIIRRVSAVEGHHVLGWIPFSRRGSGRDRLV
jgi:hypothetical protein